MELKNNGKRKKFTPKKDRTRVNVWCEGDKLKKLKILLVEEGMTLTEWFNISLEAAIE